MSSLKAGSADVNANANRTGLCNLCDVLPFDSAALHRAVQLLQAVQGRNEPFHCLQAAMSDKRVLGGVVEKGRVVSFLIVQFGMPIFAAEWLWDNYLYALKSMYYESKIGCGEGKRETEHEVFFSLQAGNEVYSTRDADENANEDVDEDDDIWLEFPSDDLRE